MEPTKKIYDESDLVNFRKAHAYNAIFNTINILINKVKHTELPYGSLDIQLVTRKPQIPNNNNNNTNSIEKIQPPVISESPLNSDTNINPNIQGVLNILNQLNQLITETPPLPGARRFGNLACRKWHDKINETLEKLIETNLSITNRGKQQYVSDLKYYLSNAFGSRMRLDYGTGHELNFVAFIGGLLQQDIIEVTKLNGQEVLIMFAKYYDLVRRLILEYNLEPAGSHGVWGLDDHFHFIYILGASQFIDDKSAPPVQQVLSTQIINEYKSKNLYINAIAFIFKIKQGPFNEHSPIIYDIHTTVSLWNKVLKGLLKMYEVEVLSKFPVVQHLWFGKLYAWKDVTTGEDLPVYQKDNDQDEVASSTITSTTTTATATAIPTTAIPTTRAPWAQPNTRTFNNRDRTIYAKR
ncbi:rotamase PTPA-1 [Scheffersomyces amazonensis]|uniref:rotamase PTPA-1 n=1 Tax=Scheffersomyces amazonensis TaxID=1078765 RepID=UPI00315D4D88